MTKAQAKQSNEDYRGRGPLDHVAPKEYGIVNYFRTPEGDQIKAIELRDGRIKERVVWTRPPPEQPGR